MSVRYPITVEITDRDELRRLGALAEAEGYATVDEYVAVIVHGLGAVRAPLDRIVRLHAEGRTVLEICQDTGQTRSYVRDRLRRVGLSANRDRVSGR